MKYIATIDDRQYTIEIIDESHVLLDGAPVEVDFHSIDKQPVFSLIVGGRSYEAYVSEGDEGWEVMLLGDRYTAQVVDEREQRLLSASSGQAAEGGIFHLRSPMPGLIVAIAVEEGQQVEKGDVLVILESMKMQNELRSPKNGVVTRIRAAEGDTVEHKATLLSVE